MRLTLAKFRSDKALFLSQFEQDGECLRWKGKKDRDGYGRFASTLVHRIAYEIFCGPIPDGMDVDHTCFVRDCGRPEHLRPLPHAVNTGLQRRAIADTCGAGHPRNAQNTYVLNVRARRDRFCRLCNAARVREYKARRRKAA